jgi:hypothetical protein
MQIDCHNRYEKRLFIGLQVHSASDTRTRNRKNISNYTSQSKAAIFNRCAAAHRCDAKGPQVCGGSLGEGRKEAIKNEE